MTTQIGLHQEEPARYTIRVRGWLGDGWKEIFDSLDLHDQTSRRYGRITTLAGRMADQAALHGLLCSLYSLGMALLVVKWDDFEEIE